MNEHGKDEADVEVVVLGAPSRPGGPLQVNNVTKNGSKLAWKAPEDDGGKPVTGYVIEKLDKGRWVTVGRSKDPEMDVTGLQEGKEYSFRVKAVNEEGDSEPLETDQAIIAKNPFGIQTTYISFTLFCICLIDYLRKKLVNLDNVMFVNIMIMMFYRYSGKNWYTGNCRLGRDERQLEMGSTKEHWWRPHHWLRHREKGEIRKQLGGNLRHRC